MTVSASVIKLFICDVDGVLTDGSLTIDAQGREAKTFHVHDGAGIKGLRVSGIEVALISGRESAATRARAAELGIQYIYLGCEDKLAALAELKQKVGVLDHEVAYIGDDLIDLPVMRRVGLAIAPANARVEVKQVAELITSLGGGQGAVREAAEYVLKAQERWAGIVERHLH
jgi:3-deoxy-D-manno-octulosonate 8-phosphate phosphatase (KDO 8-P phosphatase)